MSKRILCFGDSNTWGYDGQTGLRFAEDVRWRRLVSVLIVRPFVSVDGAFTLILTAPSVIPVDTTEGAAGIVEGP